MKQPLYPVEITEKVLKELEDDRYYACVHKIRLTTKEGEVVGSFKGIDIKGSAADFTHIYLPLSSTPLKELSEITDEDLEWLSINSDDQPNSYIRAKEDAINHGKFWITYPEDLSVKQWQYLQFKGYNVPQYYPVALLVKEEKTNDVKLGIIKGLLTGVSKGLYYDDYDKDGAVRSIKEAISLLDNLSPQSDQINPIELLEWVKENFTLSPSNTGLKINWIDKEDFLKAIINNTYTTSQLIETFKNRKR